MTKQTLLPPNATKTEQILEQAMAFDTPLRPLVQSLHQLRTKRPKALAPWLSGEWGIGQFARHFSDDSTFYSETLAHLQQRGTASAVRQALGWVHADVASVEVENFYLHIHLSREFRGNLADFKRAVAYSIPLHLDFYRITAGDDGRHGVYDYRNYDDAVYDSDAGVLIDGVLVDYADTLVAGDSIRVLAELAHTADTMIGTPVRTWQTVSTWLDEVWSSTPALQITTETV